MSVAKAEPWLLTLPQAARLLGVSARTVRRMVDSGEIPCEIVRRFGRRRLLHPCLLKEWVDEGPVHGRARQG